MKDILVSQPKEIPHSVRNSVVSEIGTALRQIVTSNDEFIVNDTKWFQLLSNRAKPTVMNSAKFITKLLADHLESLGWHTEATIMNQTIDGFKEFPSKGGLRLSKEGFFEIVGTAWDVTHEQEIPSLVSNLMHKYVCRQCFDLDPNLASDKKFFVGHEGEAEIRVGFEFETGNIASSFRALSKLDTLYKKNMIDVGVFVTSIDKSTTATRIWPVSNRNGSFEELKQRNYKGNVEIPLIEIGFEPDRIDQTAPYLGDDKTTYFPNSTGEQITIAGEIFDEYETPSSRKVLLPHWF